MKIIVTKTDLSHIAGMREKFLAENNIQFVYNKCHYYSWADEWIFTIDESIAGYGSVWGRNNRVERDEIFEFYLLEPFRKFNHFIFEEFSRNTEAKYIVSQTNDRHTSKMLFEFGNNIMAESILFEDAGMPNSEQSKMIFESVPVETVNNSNDVQFILKSEEETIGNGGLMLNYNPPYADLYYEIKEPYRRKGWGTKITVALKQEAYKLGKVPAARCNIQNKISKSTLLSAGFKVCGYIAIADIKK